MRWTACFLTLALVGAIVAPAGAACPGTSGCVFNQGCPAGATPVNAGASIQAALDAAADGATLCVGPGTYIGRIDFHGKAVRLVSSAGPSATTLDGNGLGPVVTFQTGEGPRSGLDGFRITNGRADAGGGIKILNASPTIRNSIVTQNLATGAAFPRGGGVWVGGEGAKPSITCTEFLSNSADYAGGGLATTAFADPYLRSTRFQGNDASYGGAIAAHWNGRLDLATSEFTGNQAFDGGAIHAGTPYGNVLVRRSWFSNNHASGNGGAIWVAAGLAEIVNDTFSGNVANSGGAVAGGFSSLVDVASSIFAGNQTTGPGSAALGNASSGDASVVSHYNLFFNNTGGSFQGTYGNQGIVQADPNLDACCPAKISPARNAGLPSVQFNDADGTRNDIGACGGMVL